MSDLLGMIQVFNKARLLRMRAAEAHAYERAAAKGKLERERARTYSKGDPDKNARLMLDALASSLRRKMIARLRQGGAMSLSKLSDPFRITLSTAQFQLGVLERSGLVGTRKQGRTRICLYRVGALNQLAIWLSQNGFQRE